MPLTVPLPDTARISGCQDGAGSGVQVTIGDALDGPFAGRKTSQCLYGQQPIKN